ncbi:hypothetical protein AB0H12_01565 [Actinosynnema sp. NPDC023794]
MSQGAQIRLQGEIVAVLMRCECLRTDQGRAMLVSLLSDALEEPVSLEGYEVPLQLLGVVRRCRRHAGGLRDLVECLRVMDPYAPELTELGDLGDEWAACRALPIKDWDRMAELLKSVRLADDPFDERRELRRLAGVATDGHCDDLPVRCRSVWSLFLHLADHNARPGALPPAMVLVDRLARGLGDGVVAEQLLGCTRQLAETFGVTDLVEPDRWRTARASEGDGDVVHLVFEVDPLPAGEDEVVLSHWLHWEGHGWHGRRRGDAAVRREDLEGEVDRVIATLEAELGVTPAAETVSAIVIEFVLPWEMVNTAVEFWPKASPSDATVPLAVDHPVLVRSLERARAQRYWLAWKRRWSAVSGEGARPYWSLADGVRDLTGMAVELHDASIVSLVLSEPPGDRRGRAWDEAAMALRAGIPIIIWDREDCSSSHFHEAVTSLFAAGAVRRLPHRLAQLRREALLAENSDEPHAGRTLAVLWDDAERLPNPLTSDRGPSGRG